MKYLRSFNENNIDRSEIDAICMKYKIEKYTINEDGSIDVEGNVNLYSKGLDKLPLKFGKVTGDFWCDHNQLTSLIGAPHYIGGDFDIQNNKLTNLEYGPKYVGDDFNCSDNKLTNLIGAPLHVKNNCICTSNELTSLQGCPHYIGNNFDCGDNKLTSLKGIPKHLNGVLECYSNNIKNIDYLNQDIIFNIEDNPIYNLLYLFLEFIADGSECIYVDDTDKNKDLIFEFNDREIIQNDILIIDRLVEFLEDIGKPQTKDYLYDLLKNEYEIR